MKEHNEGRTYHWRQAMTTVDISFRGFEVLATLLLVEDSLYSDEDTAGGLRPPSIGVPVGIPECREWEGS